MGASPNTGPATLNIDSKGAGALTRADGSALIGGDAPANGLLDVVCASLTPTFHLLSVTRAYAAIGLVKGFISGLTYSNNGSDPTNDIDIAAGTCVDGAGVYPITLAAITKRLDASWAVGSGNGGLDTGSIGNSDYYIWAIARSDTGVTDALFSLSATAPTMPTSYDYKRLIGWYKRVGATIVPFTTLELPGGGLQLMWTTPTLDKDVSTLSTSRITDAAKVPLDFKTQALLRTAVSNASVGAIANVCDPAEADQAPSTTASPGATHSMNVSNQADVKDMEITTSATGTVAARASAASTTYRFWTRGFRWSRR